MTRALFLLCGVLYTLCPVLSAPSDHISSTGSLHIRVIDERDRPIPEAKVIALIGRLDFSGTTDIAGNLLLEHVPNGAVTVIAIDNWQQGSAEGQADGHLYHRENERAAFSICRDSGEHTCSKKS